MEKVREILTEQLDEHMLRAIVSNPRRSGTPKKIVFRPFFEGKRLMFQKEIYENRQVFHENMDKSTTVEQICGLLARDYKQMDLQCSESTYHILVSKKGKSSIKRHMEKNARQIDLTHNRKKKYILDGSQPVPFLIDLGVQTKEGKIVDKKYKKLRQINRFLEFIRDVLPELKKRKAPDAPLRIIDFGCGKSYLTFAVYYYLKILNGMEVQMTGLDLKEDVIRHCSGLAEKYGYEGLKFSQGDISSYHEPGKVDMVITLHACDTATDFALEKAVKWGAGVILSVPCCQHELNRQIESEQLEPLFKYGILKERFSALLTDALRANLLEQNRYAVQVLEFIDMEHTPKNLLIRAVKKQEKNTENNDVKNAAAASGKNTGNSVEKAERERQRYEELCDALNSHITLEKLLSDFK